VGISSHDRIKQLALGAIGQLVLALKVLRRWGIRGLPRILRSERVFSSKQLGYGIAVGTK
jgi:hypothetical protein